MNPVFLKSLGKKRTRAVDPDAPPRPTLLGQVKELRLTKEEQQRNSLELTMLRVRVEEQQAHISRLESKLRDIENYIRSRIT